MASAGNVSAARESSAREEVCASIRWYVSWLVKGNPTLRLGQKAMFCALAGLYRALQRARTVPS
jgi:hypothetical protein